MSETVHPMIDTLAGIIDPGAFMPMSCHKSVETRAFAIEQAREKVIAVLRTLREPEEGMVAAADALKYGAPIDCYAVDATKLFTAMISSILPEEKGTET